MSHSRSRRRARAAPAVAHRLLRTATFLALLGASEAFAQGGALTTRVSVGTGGVQGNKDSYSAAVSADGRFTLFWSSASNLVPGDSNNYVDVFLHDGATQTTECLSLSMSGGVGNHGSYAEDLSPDGRFALFSSLASDLVPGDTNALSDVFLRDRASARIWRISVGSAGQQDNGGASHGVVSDDGRYVAFVSTATNLWPGDANGERDVFLHDRASGTTTCISVTPAGTTGDKFSYQPKISGDGRFVLFTSLASDLVPGDGNLKSDVLLYDRVQGILSRLSDMGGAAPAGYSFARDISRDGRFVLFSSTATELVPGDTNMAEDLFLLDRASGQLEIVSVSSSGAQGDGPSPRGAVSPDGRFVGFESFAGNLVPGDTFHTLDVFVRDRWLGQTVRISAAASGGPPNSGVYLEGMSPDGRFLSTSSWASNLVPNDTNNRTDAFLHDRAAPVFTYCLPKVTSSGCAPAIGFTGSASLAAGDLRATAAQLEGASLGVFFYSLSGSATAAFQGGLLCIQPPIARLPVQPTGGAPQTCGGTFDTGLAGVLATAGVGNPVWGQYWFRDNQAASGTGLSDALTFTVAP